MEKKLSKKKEIESIDNEIKIINGFIIFSISILGDEKVGKSCLSLNLVGTNFNPTYNVTIGKN